MAGNSTKSRALRAGGLRRWSVVASILLTASSVACVPDQGSAVGSTGPTISSFTASTGSGTSPLTTALRWEIGAGASAAGSALLCELDVDGGSDFEISVANCDSASTRPVTVSAVGATIVTLRVSDETGARSTATTVLSVEPASADSFGITVRRNGVMSAAQSDAFDAAALRWSQVIRTGLPTGSLAIVANQCGTSAPAYNADVDDLMIDATISSIDGVGGVLGRAGPCYVRAAGGLPLYGVMQFDSADVADLVATGQFEAVVMHEMGHVLGFGTVWGPLLSGAGTSDPTFLGPVSTGAWQSIGGSGAVPVENSGGGGTADAHWRESTFNAELMTGYLDAGPNPLSVVTAASFADLGYGVDLGAADSYGLATLRRGPSAPDLRFVLEPVEPIASV